MGTAARAQVIEVRGAKTHLQVAHPFGRLQGWKRFALCVRRGQAILTLVPCNNVDAAKVEDVLDGRLLPAGCRLWLFVEKESTVVMLDFVKSANEVKVNARSGHKLLYPGWIHLWIIEVLVQATPRSTRW